MFSGGSPLLSMTAFTTFMYVVVTLAICFGCVWVIRSNDDDDNQKHYELALTISARVRGMAIDQALPLARQMAPNVLIIANPQDKDDKDPEDPAAYEQRVRLMNANQKYILLNYDPATRRVLYVDCTQELCGRSCCHPMDMK
jgi:hypothetical protein